MSSVALEPAADDPLTSLPAASLDDGHATVAPMAAAAASAPAPAAAQQDLWFLSPEAETTTVDQGEQATREPSNTLTAGLTVLMALVVIGLVIAFLWLMTSLPILP
jgi:hypothetical protein